MSNPTKVPTILERLSANEQTVQGIANYTQQELASFKQALQNVVEVINGVIKASGPEFEAKVQAAITEDQNKRALEAVEREKAVLAQLIESGTHRVAEVVTEDSIVVGREFNKEGALLGVGRVQVRASQFTPEAKEQVLGKGVGFMIEVASTGGRFEVAEIYEEVPASEQKPKVSEEVVDAVVAETPSEVTPAAE